ncbi:MAG: putative transcriptional regulator [Candidatus Omnitrophota bacterium]|jgi:putative transcriptional regulator
MKSKVKEMVLETMADFHKSGGIDEITMREVRVLCLPKPGPFSARTIVKIRRKVKLSQAAFAEFLNTSVSTIQKWESGQKKPSGTALKLLSIVNDKGLASLL